MVFIAGLIMGAISWGIVALVSDRFEPFDSTPGFLMGQTLLSAVALVIGFRYRLLQVFLFIAGAYAGMNAYVYLMGGSESRAWIYLGLLTTLSLILVPALSGLLGRFLAFLILRHTTRQKTKV